MSQAQGGFVHVSGCSFIDVEADVTRSLVQTLSADGGFTKIFRFHELFVHPMESILCVFPCAALQASMNDVRQRTCADSMPVSVVFLVTTNRSEHR
jgi:hypothetical protein|mmetsp:Transcript_31245/g.50606  ORF Transcript_31245/g.50606 Transcript_31245/m.50606 type:complete len:96 (+) Transcript_31245:546-833(+)